MGKRRKYRRHLQKSVTSQNSAKLSSNSSEPRDSKADESFTVDHKDMPYEQVLEFFSVSKMKKESVPSTLKIEKECENSEEAVVNTVHSSGILVPEHFSCEVTNEENIIQEAANNVAADPLLRRIKIELEDKEIFEHTSKFCERTNSLENISLTNTANITANLEKTNLESIQTPSEEFNLVEQQVLQSSSLPNPYVDDKFENLVKKEIIEGSLSTVHVHNCHQAIPPDEKDKKSIVDRCTPEEIQNTPEPQTVEAQPIPPFKLEPDSLDIKTNNIVQEKLPESTVLKNEIDVSLQCSTPDVSMSYIGLKTELASDLPATKALEGVIPCQDDQKSEVRMSDTDEYVTCLSSLGENWSTIVDILHPGSDTYFNNEQSSHIIPPTVQELEMHLSSMLDESSDIFSDAVVVKDHLIKKRPIPPFELPSIPRPEESFSKTQADECFGQATCETNSGEIESAPSESHVGISSLNHDSSITTSESPVCNMSVEVLRNILSTSSYMSSNNLNITNINAISFPKPTSEIHSIQRQDSIGFEDDRHVLQTHELSKSPLNATNLTACVSHSSPKSSEISFCHDLDMANTGEAQVHVEAQRSGAELSTASDHLHHDKSSSLGELSKCSETKAEHNGNIVALQESQITTASCPGANEDMQLDEDNHGSTIEERSKKVKTRYELILERKEREATKAVKRPIDNEPQLKDPRLAAIRRRAQESSNSQITVINALPAESIHAKKKKYSSEGGIDLNVTTNSDSDAAEKAKRAVLLKKRELVTTTNKVSSSKRAKLQHRSDEPRAAQPATDAMSSRMRFQNRGLFLTEIASSKDKKARSQTKHTSRNVTSLHKNKSIPIDKFHETVDVSVNLDHHSGIGGNLQPSRNVAHTGASNHSYENVFSRSKQYSSSAEKDPRLQKSLLPNPQCSQQSIGHHLSNTNSASLYPSVQHSISSEPNYLNTQLSRSSATLCSAKPNQRSPGFINNNNLATAVIQSQHYASVDNPIPFQGVLSPSDGSDVSDSQSSSHSENMYISGANFVSNSCSIPHQMHHSSASRKLDNLVSSKMNLQSYLHEDHSLLPAPLKNAIGVNLLSSTDVLIIILTWSPEWLLEQNKNINMPPPLCSDVRRVAWEYSNFTEYFNTYLPLLILEGWQRIHHDWRVTIRKAMSSFSFNIRNVETKGEMIEIECSTTFQMINDIIIPSEGYLALLKFTDENQSIQIFGYVASHVFICGSSKSQTPFTKQGEQKLLLCVKIIYRLHSHVMKKVQIRALTYLKPLTNQVDALMGLDSSPFLPCFLRPRSPEFKKVVLERVKTTCPDSVLKAVSQILSSLDLEIPSPRISIVEAPFGTDQLSVLISVVEHAKTLRIGSCMPKVLVCSRSITRLREIGVRLMPTSDSDVTNSVRAIILTKPEVLNCPELHKLTLAEVVSSHLLYTKNDSVESSKSELEVAQNQVLKSCDVLLSIVTNCYESSIHTALGPDSDTPLTFCVLDEATMCTEPETIVPMLYGIKKFIFFGNHQVKIPIRNKVARENNFKLNLHTRISKAIK